MIKYFPHWLYRLKTTSRKRRIRLPLLLASGFERTSRTFVRKANLPSLLQANHVPPASTSRPPSISPPCHHARASVGLQRNKQPHNFKNQHSRMLLYFTFPFWWFIIVSTLSLPCQTESERGKEEKYGKIFTCRSWYSSRLSNRRKG